MTLSQKSYYPALTGLRALAAFLVFFHHANPFSPEGSQRNFYLFVGEFHVGVSLFFVLSGFLIYTRYADQVFKTKGWFIAYLQNRFARIYPLYFLLTTLNFLAFWISNKMAFNAESVVIYFTNITQLKGFFNELKFSGIAQGWSLTVEECFYLLAPFLFLWWNKFRFIFPLFFLASGGLLVVVFHSLHLYGFFSDFHFMMIYTFFGRCFEFFAGIALARYLKDQRNTSSSWSFTYSGLIGIVIIIGGLAFLGENGNSGLEHPLGIILNNFILPLAIVSLIYGLINEHTWMQTILSSTIAQLLGKSSYAFYLIHAGLFFAVLYRYVTQNSMLIFLLLNGLAIAIYYFIEKPLNKKWKAKEADHQRITTNLP